MSKLTWKHPKGHEADRLFQKMLDGIDKEVAKLTSDITRGALSLEEYKFASGILRGYGESRQFFLDALTESEKEDPDA
jgi:hypothetical protein